MSALLPLLRGILVLDQGVFERLRDSKHAMRTGIITLLVVFLIAGSLQFLVSVVNNVRPFTAQEAGDVQAQARQFIEPLLQRLPETDPAAQAMLDQFLQNLDAGTQMGVEIDSLRTPLPRFVSRSLQSIGVWVSQPFAHLAAFLFYSIWVLLFAKLLGGNGGVDRFLGVTALYSVPHLLAFFRPVPCLGPVLVLFGVVWGWLIYVRAVQVTQRLSAERAILAAVLPALLLVLVIALSFLLALFAVVVAAGR